MLDFSVIASVSFWLIVTFPMCDMARKSPSVQSQMWKLDRLECHNTMCEKYTCTVDRVNRYTQLISVDCDGVKKPRNEVRVHMKIYYRFKRYLPFLVDVDYDVCDYMGNKTKYQPFMDTVMPHVLRKSNLNHSCPFSGHLYIRDFVLAKDMIKGAIVPAGQYRVDISIYNYVLSDAGFTARLYISIPNGGTTDDLSMG